MTIPFCTCNSLELMALTVNSWITGLFLRSFFSSSFEESVLDIFLSGFNHVGSETSVDSSINIHMLNYKTMIYRCRQQHYKYRYVKSSFSQVQDWICDMESSGTFESSREPYRQSIGICIILSCTPITQILSCKRWRPRDFQKNFELHLYVQASL